MDEPKKLSGFIDFLEGVFEECGRARIERNIQNWYDLLIVATVNLSPEMSDFDLDFFKGLKKELFVDVGKIMDCADVEGSVLIPVDIEEKFFDWEVRLRKIRRSAGLQHSVKDDRRRFT